MNSQPPNLPGVVAHRLCPRAVKCANPNFSQTRRVANCERHFRVKPGIAGPDRAASGFRVRVDPGAWKSGMASRMSAQDHCPPFAEGASVDWVCQYTGRSGPSQPPLSIPPRVHAVALLRPPHPIHVKSWTTRPGNRAKSDRQCRARVPGGLR